MRMFSLIAVLTSSLFLAACDPSSNELAMAKASAAAAASAEATKVEAAKADSKLSTAKTEIKKVAVAAARQGGFSSSANCNVIPQELTATAAAKNFPTNAPLEYKAICAQEVATMNAERSAMKGNAIAAAKKAEQKKLAAEQKRKQQKFAAATPKHK